jgi:hypothetical protein
LIIKDALHSRRLDNRTAILQQDRYGTVSKVYGMGMGTPSRRGRMRLALFGRGTSRRGMASWKPRSIEVGFVSSTGPSPRVVRPENGSGPQEHSVLMEHYYLQHGRGNIYGGAFSDCAKYIFTSLTHSLIMSCTPRD